MPVIIGFCILIIVYLMCLPFMLRREDKRQKEEQKRRATEKKEYNPDDPFDLLQHIKLNK